MNKELLLGKVIEISSTESNDMYMSMHIRLLTNKINGNNVRFTDGFISSIVNNQDFYNGMPLVVEKSKIEAKQYSQMGHALKNKVNFETEQVGSFVSFYSKNNKETGLNELFGVAKVFKRFPKVCESIQELYDQDKLFFSVEVTVQEYKSNTARERVIDAHEGNVLIGDCIVSTPAEKASVAEILVAEEKEGENMAKNKKTEVEFFEKVVVDTAELDLDQIRSKVYSQCRETLGSDIYDYYCSEFGYDYMILRSYENATLHKIDYSVNNDEVTLGEMYEVKKTYVVAENVEDVEDVEKEVASKLDNEKEVSLNNKIEELEGKLKEKEDKITELNSIVESKDKELSESKTNVDKLSEKVAENKNVIAELEKVKSEYETLKVEISDKQKEADRELLKNKYSKLLSKEIMEQDDSKKAIEDLNSDYFKELVVNNALKEVEGKEKIVETQAINDPIITGSNDVVSKYITMN